MSKVPVICLVAAFILVACKSETVPEQKKEEPVVPEKKDSSKTADRPFGWAICKSLTDTSFNLCGGAGGTLSVTLKSTGQPMDKVIYYALKDYDNITFDGSDGPFLIDYIITLSNFRNKTISGTNGAVLKSNYEIPARVRAALDSAGVKKMDNPTGTWQLSNGSKVGEYIEYKTRQIFIDYTGDNRESYRERGIFYMNGCQNIIIRDISFIGSGSVDVGGRDLIRMNERNTNIWIDHCRFEDGMKGHINASNQSSFITVSHCHFLHSEKSYAHAFSILIGGSYRADDAGLLDVTLAYNHWDHGCAMRTPMVRSGHVHVFNNYYDCPNANGSVNARDSSHLLVENCWWSKDTPKTFTESLSSAYTLRGNYSEAGKAFPSNKGPEETVPYSYTLYSTDKVPEWVKSQAGPRTSK